MALFLLRELDLFWSEQLRQDEIVDNLSGSAGLAFNGSGNGGGGGGLYNAGTAVFQHCVVMSNSTGKGGAGAVFVLENLPGGRTIYVNWPGGRGGDGAGVYNFARLRLVGCSISNNMAGIGGSVDSSQGGGGSGGRGGGLFNSGELQMDWCHLVSNGGGAGGFGGASIGFSAGPSDDSAGGSGGGICNIGKAMIERSAIEYNAAGRGGDGEGSFYGISGGAGGNGGGIYNSGSVVLIDCRIRENNAGTGGAAGSARAPGISGAQGGEGGSGGGIFNGSTPQSERLNGTEVVENSVGKGGLGGMGGPAGANASGRVVPPGQDGPTGLDGSGPDAFGEFISFNGRSFGEEARIHLLGD